MGGTKISIDYINITVMPGRGVEHQRLEWMEYLDSEGVLKRTKLEGS